MYHDRNSTVTSRASEAIVSEDGRIRRRLNNYETTVGIHNKSDIYVASGAVNDNYGNLKNFTLPPDMPLSSSINPKINKYRIITIAGMVILIGSFLWSLTFFVEPSNKNLHDNASSGSVNDSENMDVDQLEKLANLIISDGKWSQSRIESFINSWSNISKEKRELFKSQAWYQQFSYRLQTKIKRERMIGAYSDSHAKSHSKTLSYMTLANAMGLSDKKDIYLGSTSKNDIDMIYQKLAKEVEEELVTLEKNKIKLNEDLNQDQNKNEQDNSSISTASLESASIKTDGISQSQTQLLPSADSSGSNEQLANPQLESTKIQPAKNTSPEITENDVKAVLQKYSTAYQNGNMDELTSLFGANDTTEGQQIIDKLKTNYETVFKSGTKRSLTFGGVNWETRNGVANVDSEYIAQAELPGQKGIQTVSGTAKIKLSRNNNTLNIASFELQNRKESIIRPISLNIAAKHRIAFKTKRPKSPTPAELQDLVTRMISSYESGDLQTFSSLFAKSAKTNDRNDLNGIQKDYKKLFDTSRDRQMFIKGLRWKREKDYAQGRGDLEAMVLLKSGESVYSMSGKIEIVAKRIDGKVLITRLYHLERAQ